LRSTSRRKEGNALFQKKKVMESTLEFLTKNPEQELNHEEDEINLYERESDAGYLSMGEKPKWMEEHFENYINPPILVRDNSNIEERPKSTGLEHGIFEPINEEYDIPENTIYHKKSTIADPEHVMQKARSISKRETTHLTNLIDNSNRFQHYPSVRAEHKKLTNVSIGEHFDRKNSKIFLKYGTIRSSEFPIEEKKPNSMKFNFILHDNKAQDFKHPIEHRNIDAGTPPAHEKIKEANQSFLSPSTHGHLLENKDLIPMFKGEYDQAFNFSFYFPHNNCETVVSSIKRYRTGRLSLKQNIKKKLFRNLIAHAKSVLKTQFKKSLSVTKLLSKNITPRSAVIKNSD
jgi:hypothetical protein